jgi:DNA-binding Xre family transcriptional regulator
MSPEMESVTQPASRVEIGETLGVTKKLPRRSLSQEKLRAINQAYIHGGVQSGIAAVELQELSKRLRSPAHAERRLIAALFWAKVDELREPRGLSLECVAHKSDVSFWTLQRMRKDLAEPRLTTVLRLCRGLEVTVGDLLNGLPLPTEPRRRTVGGAVRAGA